MTEKQFNKLDKEKKYILIYEESVFQMCRYEEKICYLLYQHEGFYIEVEYHLELNKITSVQTFSSVKWLEPYLELIPLPLCF